MPLQVPEVETFISRPDRLPSPTPSGDLGLAEETAQVLQLLLRGRPREREQAPDERRGRAVRPAREPRERGGPDLPRGVRLRQAEARAKLREEGPAAGGRKTTVVAVQKDSRWRSLPVITEQQNRKA